MTLFNKLGNYMTARKVIKNNIMKRLKTTSINFEFEEGHNFYLLYFDNGEKNATSGS